jgi:ABC-type nitrate/sulfonate/bicarbonate transport system substrate-binding protein
MTDLRPEPFATNLTRRSFLRTGVTLAAALPLAAASAQVVSAAGPALAPAAQGSGGTVSWQLGWTKSVQFGGFFAAIEKGFYKEEGITPDVRAGGPQISPTSLVAGGAAMVGDAGSFDVIRARAAGVPIKAIMALFQKSPFCVMSLPESPITNITDFAGKTIALPIDARPTIEALLTRGGVDPSTVTFVPVGVDPSLLTTGQVDGYFGYATNQGLILKQQGVDVIIAYTYDLGLKEYGNTYFATDSRLASDKSLLVSWLRGTSKGFDYAVAHPDEVADLMVNKYGAPGLDPAEQRAESNAQIELYTSDLTRAKGILYMDMEVWAQSADLAQNTFGLIQKPVAAEEVATVELLEQAYGGRTTLLS